MISESESGTELGSYYESESGTGSGLLKENFSELEINKVSDEYLRGLQWVMTYYKKGMPDWEWYYPEFYAPFLCDLAKKRVNLNKFENRWYLHYMSLFYLICNYYV